MKYCLILSLLFLGSTLQAQDNFGLFKNITPPNEKGFSIHRFSNKQGFSALIFIKSSFVAAHSNNTTISNKYCIKDFESINDCYFNGSVFIISLMDTNHCYNLYEYSFDKKVFRQLTFINPFINDSLPDDYKEYYKNIDSYLKTKDYFSGIIYESSDTSFVLYAAYEYHKKIIGTSLMLFKSDSTCGFSMTKQCYMKDLVPYYFDHQSKYFEYSDGMYRIKMAKTSNSFNFMWLTNFIKWKDPYEKWNRSVDDVYMYTLDADFNIKKIEELDE